MSHAPPSPANETLETLRTLVRCAREDSAILHVESMKFFKDWLIDDLRATIPRVKSRPSDEGPLDDDDVMEPDLDFSSVTMGRHRTEELSEEEEEAIGRANARARAALSDGDVAAALAAYTEVLEIKASALSYAKRAECFIKARRPNAAIKDCDAALGMNPDSAKALKIRGAARRFLGHYAAANEDLSKGLAIDYDEEYGEIHKTVLSRVHEMHVKEGKARAAKEAEARERVAKEAADARERAANAAKANASSGFSPSGFPFGSSSGVPGVTPEMAQKFANDPALMKAMENPKVMQALQAMMTNPMAAMQYANDPEVGPVLQKLMGMFSQNRDAHRKSYGMGGDMEPVSDDDEEEEEEEEATTTASGSRHRSASASAAGAAHVDDVD